MKKILQLLVALVLASPALAGDPTIVLSGQTVGLGAQAVAGITSGLVPKLLLVDADGTLHVTGAGGGGGGTSSTFGAAFPATGTALGISDGTNMVALLKGQATMANSIPVAIASNQGAFPVSQSGAWTFSSNSAFAQGSTTSGQNGALHQAAATTSAPTYVNGTTNPISLDLSGGLRVNGSGVTQPVSGTFWQATQPVSGTFFQATQPVSIAATINANAIQSGTWNVGGLGTAGTPSGGVVSIQGVVSGTAVPVSLAANQSINNAQVSGTAVSVNNGTTDAGTQRVTLSSDSTGQVKLATGANTIGALTANQTINLAQLAGTATSVNNGTTDAGTLRVTISSDSTGQTKLATGANTIGALTANQSVNTAQIAGTATSVNDAAVDAGTQRVTQAGDTAVTGQSAQTATVNNILTTSSGASATSVSGFGSATVQVNSTGTAGTYIFEGSNDNSNFITVPVYNITVFTGTPITAAVTASSANIMYVVPINFNFLRLRIATTITGGSIQAFPDYRRFTWSPAVQQVAQATAGNLNMTVGSGTITTVTTVSTLSNTTQLTPGTAATNLGKAINNTPGATDTAVGALYQSRTALAATAVTNNNYDIAAITKYRSQYVFDQEKQMPTYRASTAAGGIALAASATDVAILPGNATNNVFVTKVIISGVQTTAGEVLINIIKRSAANTSGTSAALTSVPLDSGDSAAVSLPLSYTANPTPGATVGIIDSAYVTFSPAATGVTNSTYVFNFGERGKGVKLSGVAQGLAVNLNAVTVTGGNAVITYEWREEP